MRTIPLTYGLETLVDDETFETFGHLKWHATKQTIGSRWSYAARSVHRSDGSKTVIFLHRLVVLARRGEIVHHLNENTFDNREANLEKMKHRGHRLHHSRHTGPRTGNYRGVYFDKKNQKWVARFAYQGQITCLGRFASEEDAALAWDHAARLVLGPDCFQNLKG